MGLYSLLELIKEESWTAYGEHSGFTKCYEEIKRVIKDMEYEDSLLLDSIPEPSDAERSTWHQATREYVEMLEEVVDSRKRSYELIQLNHLKEPV